jgi:hypothetical protein
MARPVRLEFGGALYHVTARGDRREAIYEEEEQGVRSSIVAFVGIGSAAWPDPFASNSVVRFTM